jgi:predicted nucleic acid-binding Zn ribbon protein
MPNYLFGCKTCPITITIHSPMDQVKVPGCLNCMTAMTRDYSFSDAHFKGQGFYSKDKND